MQYEESRKDSSTVRNPFPGLRPFRREESHLFFGRENQVSEVLRKLKANKFVGIVGNSGIGKSSFVNCGILPKLQKETNETKDKWNVVSFRPGGGPLLQMSMALKEEIKIAGLVKEENETKIIESASEMSMLAKSYFSATGRKLLVYIDQFEEIFRFHEEHEGGGAEIEIFIDIIINAIRNIEDPISFIITIRSDFLGDCSRYPKFTKAINDSQFLIPQMTRDEKRAAIVGPVEVMGAKIEEQLVETILESIGDRHDQLPLMQHSLMRTWDHWQSVKVGNEIISLSSYEAIGGMEKALSVHANEIFNELDNDKKKTCERLFKCITEKGAEGRSVRRPTSIREISQIADANISDIILIVDHFRKPGRTLLTPSSDIELTEETIIDISHESFMRIWVVLTEWLEEEHEAIKEYLRIAEAAEMHQSGKGGLMKSPELQMALNWQQENNPSKYWGIRHSKAYDRTMQYLAFSEKKFIQEQRLKEKLQKLRLVVFKTIAVVFGIGALIALAFFFYAQQQRKEAIKLQKVATEQKVKAEESAEDAFRQKVIADKQKQKALKSEEIANEQRKEAVQQTEIAEQERQFAMEQTDKANLAQQKALELRLISIARSMAVKSLQESDKILKSLSARQAYNIYRSNGGDESDPDIYSALYYAVKGLKGEDFNKAKAHTENVRSLIAAKNSDYIYSAGSDGQVFKWILKDEKFVSELIDKEAERVHKSMAISNNNKYLAVGGKYPYIKLIDLENNKTEKIKIKEGGLQFLKFTPDSKKLIFLSSNKSIMQWDFSELKEISKSSLKLNSIDVDPKGKVLAVAKAGGLVELIDLETNEHKTLYESDTKADITSVKFRDDGKMLAIGDIKGVVKLIDRTSGLVNYKLSGHTAMVNEISFNHSGNKLATASWDHSVRIWSLDQLNKQPIILNDHKDWVWSIEFSQNDKYILAGCRDNVIRTWMLDIDKMAIMICGDEKLDRNFTKKEWEDYVAVDLEYECTCLKNKPEVSDVETAQSDTLINTSMK
jgi:WD40 repeat protein/energy-coupling factor transporter ATP-binding protein EcfA2